MEGLLAVLKGVQIPISETVASTTSLSHFQINHERLYHVESTSRWCANKEIERKTFSHKFIKLTQLSNSAPHDDVSSNVFSSLLNKVFALEMIY